MMELDWKTVALLVTIAVSVGHTLWANYYLKHNIPQLYKELDELKELYHSLDKHKLTRELPKAQVKE